MGSGKSSVGPLLAQKLSCPFIDLDAEIVTATGSSINDLFSLHGEAWFRAVESEQLQKIAPDHPAVVATGGGAIIADCNRHFMHRHGTIINLKVTPDQVLERVQGTNDRPLLAGDDAYTRADALLQAREVWYQDADIRIDTGGKTVEDVIAEIMHYLKGPST